ncbi:hypothetical protein V1478_004767 [Vespula squamosa]|uniref:Uncharacterized protein n=1 Tax=Vespula squamosa TaxID=30214 RepID=A0ABD2BEP9_VESSQ
MTEHLSSFLKIQLSITINYNRPQTICEWKISKIRNARPRCCRFCSVETLKEVINIENPLWGALIRPILYYDEITNSILPSIIYIPIEITYYILEYFVEVQLKQTFRKSKDDDRRYRRKLTIVRAKWKSFAQRSSMANKRWKIMGKRVYTLLVKSSTREIGFRRDSRLIQRIVERREIGDGNDTDMEYGAATSITSVIFVTKLLR